jgi:hypothetical protein
MDFGESGGNYLQFIENKRVKSLNVGVTDKGFISFAAEKAGEKR